MNTVIFLTKSNKDDMARSIQLLAERQTAKVNGALIISHQSVISSKEAQRIARPLIDVFATTSSIKSSGNFSLSHDAQVAAMFARFAMLAYSRFPGAWLIIDEACAPTADNWAQAILRLHGGRGGKSCGLAEQDGKTLITKGPITLQLPAQMMKMFRFSTNESWRSRGRYLLMGNGFQRLDEKEALFCKLEEAENDEEPRAFEVGGKFAKPEDLASSESQISPELVGAEGSSEAPDERLMLSNQIEQATGKRPHHFTGIDKLRQMAQQLEQPAQA